MPVQGVVKKTKLLTLDMKNHGSPEPAVKTILKDIRFGTEVYRSDVILLLQSLKEKKCEENTEKPLDVKLQRVSEETEQSQKRRRWK